MISPRSGRLMINNGHLLRLDHRIFVDTPEIERLL